MITDADSDQIRNVCSLTIKEFSGAFIKTNHGFYSEEVSNRLVLSWFKKLNDLSKVELTMNHLHVRDLFIDTTDNDYDDIAILIFSEWSKILRKIDRSFRVLKFEDLGPTISFFKFRQ